MAEKTAAVDNEKGATLEQISSMVEQISREFKSKMVQVQPLMVELKVIYLLNWCRGDYFLICDIYIFNPGVAARFHGS